VHNELNSKHVFKNTWGLNKPQKESCANVIQGAANPRLKVTRCKAHLKKLKAAVAASFN